MTKRCFQIDLSPPFDTDVRVATVGYPATIRRTFNVIYPSPNPGLVLIGEYTYQFWMFFKRTRMFQVWLQSYSTIGDLTQELLREHGKRLFGRGFHSLHAKTKPPRTKPVPIGHIGFTNLDEVIKGFQPDKESKNKSAR